MVLDKSQFLKKTYGRGLKCSKKCQNLNWRYFRIFFSRDTPFAPTLKEFGEAGRRGARWYKVTFTLDFFLTLEGL